MEMLNHLHIFKNIFQLCVFITDKISQNNYYLRCSVCVCVCGTCELQVHYQRILTVTTVANHTCFYNGIVSTRLDSKEIRYFGIVLPETRSVWNMIIQRIVINYKS